MATVQESAGSEVSDLGFHESEIDRSQVYDRSSIIADAMVMVADQSPEDFDRFSPEGRICEFIDGVVYMPPSATDEHQDSTFLMALLLQGFCERRRIGIVRLGPAVLRLSETRKLEPDVFVVSNADRLRPTRALLVIEVLSGSTLRYDLETKSAVYRESDVGEVWFIDLKEKRVLVESRASDHQRLEYREERLDSSALPGFWINLAWLWADPTPLSHECLEAILASPK